MDVLTVFFSLEKPIATNSVEFPLKVNVVIDVREKKGCYIVLSLHFTLIKIRHRVNLMTSNGLFIAPLKIRAQSLRVG